MLRPSQTWLLGACAVVSFGCTVHASPSRMERHSFLMARANTVDQLVQQVRSNPKVALRYSKQFNMSKEKLVNYFRSNLTLQKLAVPKTYVVYYYTENGKIYSNRLRLKAGTPIFVTKDDGKAILKASCGNPLTSRLPEKPIISQNKPNFPVPPPPKVVQVPKDNTPTIVPPPVDNNVPPPPILEQPTVEPLISPETQPQVPSVESPLPEMEPTPEIISQGEITIPPVAGFNPALLIPLGIIPFLNGGGGGGGNPIPEPATVTALIVGGTMLAAKMRRRRS